MCLFSGSECAKGYGDFRFVFSPSPFVRRIFRQLMVLLMTTATAWREASCVPCRRLQDRKEEKREDRGRGHVDFLSNFHFGLASALTGKLRFWKSFSLKFIENAGILNICCCLLLLSLCWCRKYYHMYIRFSDSGIVAFFELFGHCTRRDAMTYFDLIIREDLQASETDTPPLCQWSAAAVVSYKCTSCSVK